MVKPIFFKKVDIDKLLQLTEKANLLQGIEAFSDVNTSYTKLEEMLMNIVNRATVTKRIPNASRKGQPWLSKVNKDLIKEKYSLIKKKSSYLNNEEKSRLIFLTKHVKKEVQMEKEKYYEQKFSEAWGNSREQWNLRPRYHPTGHLEKVVQAAQLQLKQRRMKQQNKQKLQLTVSNNSNNNEAARNEIPAGKTVQLRGQQNLRP